MRITDSILWAVCAVASISFILIPLTNDVRIFFGAAHIAASFYPFPQGVDLAWELKPIFNRIIFYALYKLATLVTPMSNWDLFGVVVKSVCLIPVFGISRFFARSVKVKNAFFLCYLSFVTVGIWGSIQAEWWGCLIAVAAIALFLRNTAICAGSAGACIVLLFFLKGITVLLVFPILAAVYLLDEFAFFERQNSFWAGAAIAFLPFVVAAFTIWPYMIPDMQMISAVAKIGAYGIFERLLFFLEWLFISWIWIPALLPGFIVGIWLFFSRIRYYPLITRIAYEVLWIVPIVIVIVTGELFGYHYLVFIPSVIVSSILAVKLS